jgi:hypothetical protein
MSIPPLTRQQIDDQMNELRLYLNHHGLVQITYRECEKYKLLLDNINSMFARMEAPPLPKRDPEHNFYECEKAVCQYAKCECLDMPKRCYEK